MSGLRAVVVAGESSGCGKTTVALALMHSLVRRGLTVQAFKAGPDFIDPGLHRVVTGRPSHNLDAWMMGPGAVREVFHRAAFDADIAVVEGVMGLFDGASGAGDEGSTAQLAKILGLPVLLAVDTKGAARSVAAKALGFHLFDPQVSFCGTVYNRLGGDNHVDLVREAAESTPSLSPAGFLRRRDGLELPSRHLGLVAVEDRPLSRDFLESLEAWLSEGLDVDSLLRRLPRIPSQPVKDAAAPQSVARIGVARDEAFSFYYDENLRLLETAGAQIVPFSPLHDDALPPDLQAMYIGGGYPELHAQGLSKNNAMRDAVRRFSISGKPVYAECGGFMYLMRSIIDANGYEHSMVGVFDCSCRMEKRFAALGYREIQPVKDCLIGGAGDILRGHEFHYSALTQSDCGAANFYAATDRKGRSVEAAGFVQGNTLASYVHLHFGGNPASADAIVQAAMRYR